jgi:hypothetical protein
LATLSATKKKVLYHGHQAVEEEEDDEPEPEQGRPVLLLSKKQQELFPHLAAIRTTSIPFSRTLSAATSKITPKTSPQSKSPPQPPPPPQQQQQQPVEQVAEEPVEKDKDEPAKEAEPVKTAKDEKTSKSRSTSIPSSAPSPASSATSSSSKKQRKTPKKPNSSELVESDSDSGTEVDKKSVKSAKSNDSISKSKTGPKGRNWSSIKRKEVPGADSGEDEPLRATNLSKKLAVEKKPKLVPATKKEDNDDLDLVIFFFSLSLSSTRLGKHSGTNVTKLFTAVSYDFSPFRCSWLYPQTLD